jgi:tripartite-type tricarboxylate transporter receptor subunit TctC
MKKSIFMVIAAGLILSSNSMAQDFSGKRIEIIVSAGAGGNS